MLYLCLPCRLVNSCWGTFIPFLKLIFGFVILNTLTKISLTSEEKLTVDFSVYWHLMPVPTGSMKSHLGNLCIQIDTHHSSCYHPYWTQASTSICLIHVTQVRLGKVRLHRHNSFKKKVLPGADSRDCKGGSPYSGMSVSFWVWFLDIFLLVSFFGMWFISFLWPNVKVMSNVENVPVN